MQLIQKIKQNKEFWIGIFILIGGIIAAYIVWPERFRRMPSETEKYLQRQNDSLKAEIEKERELRIAESQRIDSVLTVISETDFKIIRSKEYHERIVHHYDTASVRELERILTDRFNSQNK